MAQALDPDPPAARGVAFELERLALERGRLEVTGRWNGVRGRRFVRPTLTVHSGERRRRLLADLDDKPWAPDGSPWRAAFPWERALDELQQAELSVAPDISIALPVPAADRRRGLRPPASVAWEEHRRTRAEAERLQERVRSLEQLAERLRAEGEQAKAQQLAGEEELGRQRLAHHQALAELEQSRQEQDALAAERDQLRERCEWLEAQSEELAARVQRLTADGEAAAAAGKEREAERERLHAERDRLAAERDRLAAERDRLAAERDELTERCQQLLGEGEQLRERCCQLEAERDDARAARGAALVMHNARVNAHPDGEPSWTVRLLAVGLLVGALIAALAAVHAL